MARSTKTALLLLILAGVMMFLPLPESGRLVNALQDLGHVGVGALLAFFVCRILSDHVGLGVGPATVLALVITAVVLACVEFLQPVFGRSRSLADLMTGVLAGAGALTLMLAHGRDGLGKFLVWLVGMALLLAAAATPGKVFVDVARQYREAPLLASFEDELELGRWGFESATAVRSTDNVTHEYWSLQVDLQPAHKPKQYPAATLAGPYPDWRDYGLLKFNVYLDGGTGLDLIVKVVDADHDETYDDRFQRTISLLPGANECKIDLADIEEGPRDRKLDMSRIRSLQLFVDGLAAPRTIYLDHVRLVGRRTDDDPAPRWSAPGG